MPEHGVATRDHGSVCTGLVQGSRGSWKDQSSKGISPNKVRVPLSGSRTYAQLRLTCCDPMDCSPSGSSVHGIFQARILEWVPYPGDFPGPGIQPMFPALAGRFFTTEPAGKPL